jgi:hypothetical protein
MLSIYNSIRKHVKILFLEDDVIGPSGPCMHTCTGPENARVLSKLIHNNLGLARSKPQFTHFKKVIGVARCIDSKATM